MNGSGQFLVAQTCEPTLAVERFLASMRRAADRSFPRWLDVLKAGLEDCTLDYDAQRAVFDIHPLDDLYFAAAVGLETARIRGLFGPAQSRELLSAIAERVDAVADRKDRVVSTFVFTVISRVDPTALTQETPHDQVIALLLTHIGIATTPGTRHLMSDLLFRHHLGEPLALQIPQWWPAFHSKFTLAGAGEDEMAVETIISPALTLAPPPPTPARRRSTARRLI